MRNILTAVIILFVFFAGCKTKKLTLANPQEDIESAIVDCINLLEQKRYNELLSKYIYPDVKEEILKEQTIEQIAEGFKKKKAARLLNAMKVAQTKEIKYSNEGMLGTIELGEISNGPNELKFMKKDKLWYIAD